jgi:hypothetical protein
VRDQDYRIHRNHRTADYQSRSPRSAAAGRLEGGYQALRFYQHLASFIQPRGARSAGGEMGLYFEHLGCAELAVEQCV